MFYIRSDKINRFSISTGDEGSYTEALPWAADVSYGNYALNINANDSGSSSCNLALKKKAMIDRLIEIYQNCTKQN